MIRTAFRFFQVSRLESECRRGETLAQTESIDLDPVAAGNDRTGERALCDTFL